MRFVSLRKGIFIFVYMRACASRNWWRRLKNKGIGTKQQAESRRESRTSKFALTLQNSTGHIGGGRRCARVSILFSRARGKMLAEPFCRSTWTWSVMLRRKQTRCSKGKSGLASKLTRRSSTQDPSTHRHREKSTWDWLWQLSMHEPKDSRLKRQILRLHKSISIRRELWWRTSLVAVAITMIILISSQPVRVSMCCAHQALGMKGLSSEVCI